MIQISIFPTFWQRVKFMFCKRVTIEGSPKNIKEPLNLSFNF